MVGIGVDMVDVREVRRLMALPGGQFVRKTFTQREQQAGTESPDPTVYFAERFAAKEAVFKAIAHHTQEKSFDFRIVETLNHPDGCPYIVYSEHLLEYMRQAGASQISISLSAEGDYAVAFALAM